MNNSDRKRRGMNEQQQVGNTRTCIVGVGAAGGNETMRGSGTCRLPRGHTACVRLSSGTIVGDVLGGRISGSVQRARYGSPVASTKALAVRLTAPVLTDSRTRVGDCEVGIPTTVGPPCASYGSSSHATECRSNHARTSRSHQSPDPTRESHGRQPGAGWVR